METINQSAKFSPICSLTCKIKFTKRLIWGYPQTPFRAGVPHGRASQPAPRSCLLPCNPVLSSTRGGTGSAAGCGCCSLPRSNARTGRYSPLASCLVFARFADAAPAAVRPRAPPCQRVSSSLAAAPNATPLRLGAAQPRRRVLGATRVFVESSAPHAVRPHRRSREACDRTSFPRFENFPSWNFCNFKFLRV